MQKVLTFAEVSPAAAGGATPSSVAVVGSPAGTPAGVAMSAPVSLEQFSAISVYASLVGAGGGTLDVYLQTMADGASIWEDYAHFPQLGIGAAAIKYAFSVSQNGQVLVPVVVGINLTPALAANTVVGGAWGDRFRLLMVPGAGHVGGAVVSVVLSATKP